LNTAPKSSRLANTGSIFSRANTPVVVPPAPIASTAIPDFASLAKLAVRIPKSVADRDPDLADVRHPTDDRS